MFALLLITNVFAQDACPAGKARSEFTLGECCWPGQAFDGAHCVGIPSCPDGMKTLPDRCEVVKKAAVVVAPKKALAMRNVVFAGGDFSGQILHVDELERGPLPNAFELEVGERRWAVYNTLGQLLIEGRVKVRKGEGDQIVMIKAPGDPESAPAE